MIKLSYQRYYLELKYPFTIASFSRTGTPIILLTLSYQGINGYGEASLVPYMGENYQTAEAFLDKLDLSWIRPRFQYDEILDYLDSVANGNPAIKAAIDIALHDLEGKLTAQPCFELFGVNPSRMPVTSITIGMDKPEVVIEKVKDAHPCNVLKVKLGCDDDKTLIGTIRSVSNLPLYVDANQGWNNREKSLDLIYWLKEQGCLLIEQPMDKNNPDANAWLTERSPLPIIADEAVQRFADVQKIAGAYHGINVKLMKSAGMHEAHKMILKARELNLKVLVGCMSETSCATLAAAALAPLCNWADIDGPFLTKNNPYKMPDFKNGRWVLSKEPGLGLTEID